MAQLIDIVGTISDKFSINDAVLKSDANKHTLESNVGFGIQNSKYISNAIVSMKEPLRYEGMKLILPSGMTAMYSDGRDSTNNNLLLSLEQTTKRDYFLNMEGFDLELDTYEVFFDNTDDTILICLRDNVFIGEEPDDTYYRIWRKVSANLYFRKENEEWKQHYLIKVGSFDYGTDGISSFTPCYPTDLLKLNDYVMAAGGSGGSGKVYRMEIPASDTETETITLTKRCKKIENIVILVEHTEIPMSYYTLDRTGFIITFAEPVPAGLRIDLRWS